MSRVRQALRAVGFALWFARELVVSNLVVVWDVVTPRSRLAPGIVSVPLRSRTDVEVTAIANLITLTPGTLTLAVVRDPNVLYVHGMYAPDAERFRAELLDMEARLLRAMRADGGRAPARTSEGARP